MPTYPHACVVGGLLIRAFGAASVRRRLGDSGAVDAIGRYLENTTSSTSATRAHCFAALVQLSFDGKRSTLASSSLVAAKSRKLTVQMS
jgi:hypothetical protein